MKRSLAVTRWVSLGLMVVSLLLIFRKLPQLGVFQELGPWGQPIRWILLGVAGVTTVLVILDITWKVRRNAAATQTLAGSVSDGPLKTVAYASGSVLLAFIVLGIAVFVQVRPNLVDQWILGWFGPPKVVLTEAYKVKPDGPTFDHSRFNTLLKAHVDGEGWVDYQALQKDPARLDAYITSVGKAPFDALGRNEKLALLLNAYNAFTLQLILNHYPLDSIRDIPAEKRWDAQRWQVGKHTWSLNQIEHEQIRPKFIEPRIHFALVCAARGCPPLRQEAYVASRLNEQLEKQANYVHDHATWFRHDSQANTVHLTKLYHPAWYGSDFEQLSGTSPLDFTPLYQGQREKFENKPGTVLAFIANHARDLRKALEEGKSPEVRWLDYDWKLNSVANRQPR